MGCPSLYVWALIAAAYTTVQSFGFLAVNTLLILTHYDVYKASTNFFGKISLYTIPDDPAHNCTGAEGVVSPETVVAYQYTFLVLHVLWIIAGLIVISQLCRKTRSLRDYVMWMVVAVILILLDTVTGILFIIDSAGMAPDDDTCQEAAFCMILLSFRWFIFFIINVACVIVVALVMRREKAVARRPENNYLDPPSNKRLQDNNQEIGPPGARPRKPPAALPTETLERRGGKSHLGEQVQFESELRDQFGPDHLEAPTGNVAQTSFTTNSPIQVEQGDYLPPATHNWQDIPLDQHMYPTSDSQQQTHDVHSYPKPQQSLDNTPDDPMSQEERSFRYTGAGTPGHDPRQLMEQGEQPPFERRFELDSERQGDFARSQYDDKHRYMPPPQSRHAYDNPAWTGDAPYEEDHFSHDPPGPQGGHRPPPRAKRNASNRRKRAAPQPKETLTEESIEEEEVEQAAKPPKATSLAPTASFDPRPFSYLNPTFRPLDHADVKAMKTHPADIVKTLDQETKHLKEKDKLSEGADATAIGVISSPPVRNYLNDSGRRNNVKRSTSLRDQLARSGKAAAREQPFNKQSSKRPNAVRDLDSIEESSSSDSVAEARPRPPRRHAGDSARPGRTAAERDEQKRPNGDDTHRHRGGEEDRGAQRRPHYDRKHARRDQTDAPNEDDYDSSDYEDEKKIASRHREPVFITAV